MIASRNPEKYPNQKVLAVNRNGYAWHVPFVLDGEILFLKTIYPSRVSTARYLRAED